jgi:hypothetical protein
MTSASPAAQIYAHVELAVSTGGLCWLVVRSTHVALAFSLFALRERLSKVEQLVRTFENFSFIGLTDNDATGIFFISSFYDTMK